MSHSDVAIPLRAPLPLVTADPVVAYRARATDLRVQVPQGLGGASCAALLLCCNHCAAWVEAVGWVAGRCRLEKSGRGGKGEGGKRVGW